MMSESATLALIAIALGVLAIFLLATAWLEWRRRSLRRELGYKGSAVPTITAPGHHFEVGDHIRIGQDEEREVIGKTADTITIGGRR